MTDMNKNLIKGIGIGVAATSMLNVIGGIVSNIIARKRAKKALESILDECTEDTTPNPCAAESEE